MALEHVQEGSPHVASHNEERDAISQLQQEMEAVTNPVVMATGPVINKNTGSVLNGYRFKILADPTKPTEIDDIIIEATG